MTLDSLPGGPVAITVRGHSVFGEGGVPQYALVVNGDFRCGSCTWGGKAAGKCRAVACRRMQAAPFALHLVPPRGLSCAAADQLPATPVLAHLQRRPHQAWGARQRGPVHHHSCQ